MGRRAPPPRQHTLAKVRALLDAVQPAAINPRDHLDDALEEEEEIMRDLAAMEEHLDLNDQEEVIRVRSLRDD